MSKYIPIYDPIIRDIPDFPNYQISEYGEVYNKITGCELKIYVAKCGYKMVNLRKNKKHCAQYIHRLLAELFIKKDGVKNIIDHIDRDKLNNKLENLRYVTQSENGMNRTHNNNNTLGIKGVSISGNLYVSQIMLCGKRFVKSFKNLEEATTWRNQKEIELFGKFGPNKLE